MTFYTFKRIEVKISLIYKQLPYPLTWLFIFIFLPIQSLDAKQIFERH